MKTTGVGIYLMTVVETSQNVLSSPIAIYQEQSEAFSNSESIIISSKSNSFVMSQNTLNKKKHADNREFTCGFAAAFINITVTFPMNKVMFRQMLHGISTASALSQLKKEGMKNLYRGIFPPLCQKTISTSIMFGMFEKYKQLLHHNYSFLSPFANLATAASLAGCTEAILCPLERIQTVLQDKKFHGMYKNTLHCAKDFHQFGFSEYYRGLSLILIRNSVSNVMFFGLRNEIKGVLPSFGDAWYDQVIGDFVSGSFLGATISTIMYPLNVVKAHQQCQVGGPFQSMYGTFLDVYNSRGRRITSLFRGCHVNYTRALVSWGIINASYEFLLKTFYDKNQTQDDEQ